MTQEIYHPRGEQHKSSKLTESDVRVIRALWTTGLYSQRVIALKFGVKQQTIEKIVKRLLWKHI